MAGYSRKAFTSKPDSRRAEMAKTNSAFPKHCLLANGKPQPKRPNLHSADYLHILQNTRMVGNGTAYTKAEESRIHRAYQHILQTRIMRTTALLGGTPSRLAPMVHRAYSQYESSHSSKRSMRALLAWAAFTMMAPLTYSTICTTTP